MGAIGTFLSNPFHAPGPKTLSVLAPRLLSRSNREWFHDDLVEIASLDRDWCYFRSLMVCNKPYCAEILGSPRTKYSRSYVCAPTKTARCSLGKASLRVRKTTRVKWRSCRRVGNHGHSSVAFTNPSNVGINVHYALDRSAETHPGLPLQCHSFPFARRLQVSSHPRVTDHFTSCTFFLLLQLGCRSAKLFHRQFPRLAQALKVLLPLLRILSRCCRRVRRLCYLRE